MKDYTQARLNMVNCHLRTNKLTNNALIEAFSTVAREEFVGEDQKNIAYIDEDLPLGNKRFLMDPMVLARLLQASDPRAEEIALVVGANGGYSAAILSQVVSSVFALEERVEDVAAMNERFKRFSINNAVAVKGALLGGYARGGPYSLILIDGGAYDIPEALAAQLSEGGRLAFVHLDQRTHGKQSLGCASLLEKRQGELSLRVLFDANTPALPAFETERGAFVF